MDLNFSKALTLMAAPQIETARQRLARLQTSDLSKPLQTEVEYHGLARIVTEIKAFRKEWNTYTKPLRAATKEAHSLACKQFTDIDNPLEALEGRIKPLLIDWDNRQEALRLEKEKVINATIAEQMPTQDGVPPLVVTVPRMVSAEGLTRRHTWHAEVKDLKALARAVADGVVPEVYLQANMSVLNTQAKALKNEMKIPGVVAVEEADLAIRAG